MPINTTLVSSGLKVAIIMMAIPAIAWTKPLKIPKHTFDHQHSFTELPANNSPHEIPLEKQNWIFPKRPWHEPSIRDINCSDFSNPMLLPITRSQPLPFVVKSQVLQPILATAQFPHHKIPKNPTTEFPSIAHHWYARLDNQIYKQIFKAKEESTKALIQAKVQSLKLTPQSFSLDPLVISNEALSLSLKLSYLACPKAKIATIAMTSLTLPCEIKIEGPLQESQLGCQNAALEFIKRPEFSTEPKKLVNEHQVILPYFIYTTTIDPFSQLAFHHPYPTRGKAIAFNQTKYCINIVKSHQFTDDRETELITPRYQSLTRQQNSNPIVPINVVNHLTHTPEFAFKETANIKKLRYGLKTVKHHQHAALQKQPSGITFCYPAFIANVPDDSITKQSIHPILQDIELNFFYLEPSALILEPLPLTIALPTLSETGFKIRDHMAMGFIHFRAHQILPKAFITKELTTNLLVVTDKLSAPKSKRQKAQMPFRPHSIDSVGQWVDCDLYISPLVISSHEPLLPIFSLDAVPDGRPLLQTTGALIPTLALNFSKFSELAADCIALLPQDASIKKTLCFDTQFQPSKELFLGNLSLDSSFSIKKCTSQSFNFEPFVITAYDHRRNLIKSTSIPMHPAALSPLNELNSISLLHEAKKQHSSRLVFARSDAYIRKFGHSPTFETHQIKPIPISMPKAITPPSLSIGPQQLWCATPEQKPSLPFPTSINRIRLALCEDVNRKNRLTFANLSGIPSLYELDTTTLNTEFSVELAWMPKANSKRYSYAITLKTCESAHFARIPQNIHFVIDNTLPLDKTKISTYKGGILRALPYIHQDDCFNIISYEDGLISFSPVPLAVTPSSKAAARAYLNGLSLKRSHKKTNTYKMLNQIYTELQDQPGLHTVLLLTDGQSLPFLPKKGEEARTLVLNNQNLFSLYPASSGSQVAHRHLQILSATQRGRPFYAPNLVSFPRKFAAFVKKLNEPIARDLYPVVLPSNPDTKHRLYTENPRLPNLYRSTPLVIYGETDSLEPFTLMLQARLKGRYVNISKKMVFSPTPSTSAQLFDQQLYDENAKFISDLFHKSTRDALEQANNILSLCKS